MFRRNFLSGITAMGLSSFISLKNKVTSERNSDLDFQENARKYWYTMLYDICHPVFFNLANEQLVENMPIYTPTKYDGRKNVSYLEAVGRSIAGAAPWLALPDDKTKEGVMRKELRLLFLRGIANGVNPESPDVLNFETEKQPIIDAGHLAHGFLRAPKALWEPLDDLTKKRLINKFKALRTRKAHNNNWLIFRAITECFLLSIGEEWKKSYVDNALKKFKDWYVGDGWYSDGIKFSLNYYNSMAMHPMLVDTLKVLTENNLAKEEDYILAVNRMKRHVVLLERMISPEGTFPLIGRSITYRTGVFHSLAMLALNENLPDTIEPSQVRTSLTMVKRKLLVKEIFDNKGWLNLGFKGKQPNVADYYTSTGSLYMTTLSFLPLGLPASNNFWTSPSIDWTTKKAWKGKDFPKDFQVQY